MNRIWLHYQGDVGNYRIHRMLTIAWALMIPIAWLLGWYTAVAFVSACSIYANLVGHWSGMQAARAAIAIEKQNEEEARPEGFEPSTNPA